MLDQSITKKADLVIICNEQRKEQFIGFSPTNLIVIHNTPQEIQVKSQSVISNKHDKVRICYIGILQPGRLLVELGEFVSENADYELHIAGFGLYEEYFKELARTHKNIFFYGKITYDMTLCLEMNCDIMLATYDTTNRNNRFAAPNKFYEALMLGKPIIMTQGMGMSDIIKKYKLGQLIEFSKDGLAHGIKKLVEEKHRWNQIESEGKVLYNENYSWNLMQKRLLSSYKKLNSK